MANVKRCDRCGNIYDHIEDEKKTLFIFKYNSSDIDGWPDERLDLCNDCYKDLEKFINIKDHEEHEVYRKFKKDIEETLQWFKDGTISAEEAIDCVQTSVKTLIIIQERIEMYEQY